jgi:hypothetical protein
MASARRRGAEPGHYYALSGISARNGVVRRRVDSRRQATVDRSSPRR